MNLRQPASEGQHERQSRLDAPPPPVAAKVVSKLEQGERRPSRIQSLPTTGNDQRDHQNSRQDQSTPAHHEPGDKQKCYDDLNAWHERREGCGKWICMKIRRGSEPPRSSAGRCNNWCQNLVRRSLSGILRWSGTAGRYSDLTLAALLGHASRSIAQRYIHIDEPFRAAATAVPDKIDGLLDEADGRVCVGLARRATSITVLFSETSASHGDATTRILSLIRSWIICR